MISKIVSIGEHLFELKYSTNNVQQIFYTTFPHIEILARSDKPSDLVITLDGGYGKPFFNYEVFTSVEKGSIIFNRKDYLIRLDKSFKCATIHFHNELALKHAMMNLYSAFIVHNNWGLLIHSSCVVDDGKAHIFSGHSGAGKSTAAKLSQPRELLSDEATIVKVTDKDIVIYNSPFRSELESKPTEGIVPLESINLLYQALSNERLALKKSEALLQLIDKVFYWSYKKEETAKIIQLLKLLVDTIPIYQLHFQKNDTFWELISNDNIYASR